MRDATDTGVREAGIDARLGEIGGAIQEAMESYEVVLGGTAYPVKSIRNLNGHTIERYTIHGTKSVPIVKTADQTKMEEGEIFAIETFGSTGNGYVRDEGEVSHYAKRADAPNVPLRLSSAKSLLSVITKNLAPCPSVEGIWTAWARTSTFWGYVFFSSFFFLFFSFLLLFSSFFQEVLIFIPSPS